MQRSFGVRQGLLVACLSTAIGCPSAVIESPEEGQSFNAAGGVADVPVSVLFETDPRTTIDPASFGATLEEIDTGIADITDAFAVDEAGADTTLVALPVGSYVLGVSIANDLGLDGASERSFSVQSDKATFVGGTNRMSLGGVDDQCFLGILEQFLPIGEDLGLTDVPSFEEIEQNGPITVTLPLPEPFEPFDVQLEVIGDFVYLVDDVIPVFDTTPGTGGEITCLVGADYGGAFIRTSDTTVDALVGLSNVTLADPPGATCNLPQPSSECFVTLRLDGVSF